MSLTPEFLTREQAAEVTNTSVDYLRKQINSGKLRAKKSGDGGGGKFLISRDALREWFEQLEDA